MADFYRKALGWQVEQMPGIDYWRIQTGATEGPALHGGLTYRAIPDLNGWMLFVNVASLDETVARIQTLGRFDCPPQDGGAQNRLGDHRRRPREKHFWRLAGGPNCLSDAGAGLTPITS